MNNVVNFLADLTKDLKEPITKKELAELYNAEYGTNYGPQVFANSEKLALKIMVSNHSTQQKAYMFFIAKVPLVHKHFKAKLEKIGEIELDEKYCLTKFTVGGTVLFQLPDKSNYERSVHKFCTKFSKHANSPVTRTILYKEFMAQGGTGCPQKFKKTFMQVFNEIMNSDRSLEKKAKFCFTMGVPISNEILKELKNIGMCWVNKFNQITMFKSSDGQLQFSGKPRKPGNGRGKGSEESVDATTASDIVMAPAPESLKAPEAVQTPVKSFEVDNAPEAVQAPLKPSKSHMDSTPVNQDSEATSSLQVSAVKTTSAPRPSETFKNTPEVFRIPKISSRVSVDPRAIAEPPRKRPMERVLSTAKRMKNEKAMKDYYQRHRELTLQGQNQQRDTVAASTSSMPSRVKKVRFTETFEVREFRKEDWIVPPSRVAMDSSTPEGDSPTTVLQEESSGAHLHMAPPTAPRPAMEAPTLSEPTVQQRVFENMDSSNGAPEGAMETTHEEPTETTHEDTAESTYDGPSMTIHETTVVATHEVQPEATHEVGPTSTEAPIETSHEDSATTSHEALAPPPPLLNLRKPISVKPEPLDDYDDDVLIWKELPKKSSKIVIKKEPKDPEEEEDYQYNPIPFNLNIVREEVMEALEVFEAPNDTPKGPMIHRMLEDFSGILEAQLLEIHSEKFSELIQKWKGLENAMKYGKVTLTRQELLSSFESIIGKRLSPVLEFEEGISAQEFLEDIQWKIKRHQVINVENEEEKLLWKAVKKVFKNKLATVDQYQVFTYNTIITCFSKLVKVFELLCE